MKRDTFTMSLGFADELIIDNFAGGGGTSTGLEAAFGRPVDIAINHDAQALAMHAANHPHTRHLCESVWDVDPIEVTGNQPVALVWLSPDCKHFSKAKGGKPVEKRIRGLAWVALRWAALTKPRVLMLENVEEFKTWGPLLIDAEGNAKPDPAKKGKTFDSFVRQLRAMGYTVDHRELRACDFGAPTIRKRFFLVARRDGLPICWPAPSHGAPGSAAVKAGKLLPWRTAAECIDWSIPCPSIFGRQRELADATKRRIAKGIMRYVIGSANPFIVPLTHQGVERTESLDEPMRTVTGANRGERALVAPTVVPIANYGAGDTRVHDVAAPLSTITAHPRGGAHALSAATLVQTGYGEREGQAPRALDIEKPLGTVVGGAAKHALVAATLAGVGGRAGQSRPRGVDEPGATLTSKYDTALVSAVLVDAAHGEVSPGGVKRWGAGTKDIAQPLGTVTASGGNQAMAAVHLTKFRQNSTGSAMDEPMHTITAGGGKPERPATGGAMGLVSAFLAKHYTGVVGSDLVDPLGTVTSSDHHSLVAANIVKLRGTSQDGQPADEPLHTVSAGGQHHAEVRSFLLAYYGTDQAQQLDDPLATVTSRDRFGLVTIQGQPYQIVDIGLRMLSPRELFRAQGFPSYYVIGDDPSQGLTLTKSAQVRMCGNSVCPPMSEALVRTNFAHEALIAGRVGP